MNKRKQLITKQTIFLLIVLTLVIFGITFFVYSNYSKVEQPQLTTRPTQSPEKIEDEMTFTFVGDAMFGRGVYQYFPENFTDLLRNFDKSIFQNKNIAILNLEGPIVQNNFYPNTDPENLIMKFPPQTKDALLSIGINNVNLANNHTNNQGQAVLDFTREMLNNSQISTIGDPQNSKDLVKTFQKDNQKISIIAINILANKPDLDALIKKQKDSGAFVIVFPHWGEEYQISHNLSQENLAHAWIDEGADLIIGSHPHVIQDAELYKNRPIIYSLGNFVFDQTFSQNTQRGLIVSGKVIGEKLSLEFIPIKSFHLRPEILEGEEKNQIIEKLRKNLEINSDGMIEINLN